jgi:hypothetical protein
VNKVRQETELLSLFLERLQPKSGNTFVVVQVSVQNLASSPPNPLPEADALISGVGLYSEKPAPPNALSLKDVVLISEDGTTYSLAGFGVGDAGEGDFAIAPNLTDFQAASSEAKATYSFVFEVAEDALGQPLKLQYQEIPPIPFTVQ